MSFAYLAPAFQLFEALFSGSIDAIKSSVALNNPTSISAVVFTGFVAYCFLGGLITNTHSFVDQLWSISPIVYAVIYAYLASGEPRVLIMAAIVTAWGVRLTYNFARKGGYSGVEDYRWEVLRSKYITSRVAFEFFNLTYISTFQHMMIFGFVSPIAFAWYGSSVIPVPWGVTDTLATIACVFFLVFEVIADQQQWNFQNLKRDVNNGTRTISTADPLYADCKCGFLTQGLFAYCRHPNYFGETAFWFSYALFTLSSSGGFPTAGGFTGALVLIANFHFSTDFGEAISSEKYKEYALYQKSTSRLLPWIPGTLSPKRE